MVGGPTLTPLVRRAVSSALKVRVDTSANPLTVVAEGAALYGATQPLPATSKQPTQVRNAVALELIYKSVTDDDSQLVGCKVDDSVATLEFAKTDKTWASGQLPVSGGGASVRVPLPAKGPHEFAIQARTAGGGSIPVDPDSITITRGLTAAAAPLSRSLGVVVEERSGARGALVSTQKRSASGAGPI